MAARPAQSSPACSGWGKCKKCRPTGDQTLLRLRYNESVVIHDRLPLAKVPLMTKKEYFTRGCTALLDAVGGAIHHIGNIHKYARREDVPEKTLFVITTAGYMQPAALSPIQP